MLTGDVVCTGELDRFGRAVYRPQLSRWKRLLRAMTLGIWRPWHIVRGDVDGRTMALVVERERVHIIGNVTGGSERGAVGIRVGGPGTVSVLGMVRGGEIVQPL